MPVTVAVEPYTACHRGERHNSTSSTSSTTTTAGAEFVNGKQPCGGESTESIPTRLVGVVPRPAANPMRFVASGRAPLLRSASEQLQKVERVKQEIHAPLKEEEPAEWQNNLDNWKSSRRKRQEDVIERLSEVKRLEEQGHNDPRRPNKTFGQIMQQRNKRGGSGGRVLQVYTDDENDIASMLASLRPAGPPQSSASSSTETSTTTTMLGSRAGDNRSDAGFNTGSDTSSEPSDQPESEDKVLRRDISTGADAGYQAAPAGQSAAQSCSGNVLSDTCVETSCRPSLCSLSPSTAIVSKLTAGVGQDDSGTDECTCESAVRGYLNFADQRVVDCWRHSPVNLDCHVIQDDDGPDSIHDDDDEDDDGVEGHQLVDTADLPSAVFDSDASSLSASRVAAAVSSRVLGQQPSSLAGERHFSCSALKRRARSLSVESGPEERQSACLSATDNVRLRRSEMTVTSSRAVPGREDVARRRSLFEPQSFASSTCSTSPVTASSVGPKVSETDDILKQLSEKGGLKQRIASLPLQSTESVVMSCVGADQSRGHGTSSGCSRDQAASTGDSSFRQKVALFSQTEPGAPSSSCRRGVSVSGEDGKCEREADRHHGRDRSKRSLSVDHLSSNNTAGDVTAVNHDGVEDAQSPHAQLSAVDLKLRFEQLATAAEKELAAAAAAASNQQHARRTSSTSASNNNNIKKRDRASVQQSCSGSSQARQEHADSAPCKSLGDSVVKPLSSGCQSSNNDISTTRPVSTAIKSPLQHASDNHLSTTVSQADEHVEGEGSTVLDLTGAGTGGGATPPSEKPPPPPGVPSTSRAAGSNHSAVNTQLRSPAEIREDLLRRKFDFLGIQECSVKPACDQTCQVDEELDRQEREIIEGLEREENWRLQQQAKYRSRLSKMSASSAGPPSSPNISPPVTDTRAWSQSQQCLSSSLLPATTSSAIVASAPQSASVADNTAASLPYSRSIPNLTSCDVLQHQTQASSSRGVDQHHRQSSLCGGGGGSVVTTRDQYPDRQTNKPAAGMQAGAGRSILRHDALQQQQQQPRRRIDPNRDPSQHWLIQEAEHRRIREFRERESVRKSQSLPHGVVAGAQATPSFQASTNGHRVLSRQSPPTNNGHMTSHDDVTFASTQNNIGRPISEEAALFGRASTNQQPPSLHHAHSPTNQMASSMFHQPIGARVSADAELPHSQPQSQPIYENTQHLSGKRSTPPFNNRGQMGAVSESRFNCASPSSSSCSSHVRAATSGVTAGGGGGVEDKVLSVSGRKQCSHCLSELGRGAAMIIESLQLFYHIGCFRCCVCNVQLGNGTAGADVRVRNNSLHCHDCYSNDQGVKFSKV